MFTSESALQEDIFIFEFYEHEFCITKKLLFILFEDKHLLWVLDFLVAPEAPERAKNRFNFI